MPIFSTSPFPSNSSYRLAAHRYFNLFRLIVAALLISLMPLMDVGKESPQLYLVTSIVYFTAVLALGFPDALRRFGIDRLITIQMVIDILVLTVIMWASGGYDSGIPMLMMAYLAAGGLVAEGKKVMFFAALATVAVLAENTLRPVIYHQEADPILVGLACISFFAIAFSAHRLALRARDNEFLAFQRGEALGLQQAINERIIHDMQDGVVVLSPNDTIRQSNPRASSLLGIELTSGMLAKDVDANLADCRDYPHNAKGILRRAGIAQRLLRFRAMDTTPEQKGKGDLIIYLTDYDEIQSHMQQGKLAALGRLTASMAHEIRNPLAAISQAAELLDEEPCNELQHRLLQIIRNNSQRIVRMVKDVLALGRRDTVMRETVQLRPFIDDIIEEIALSSPFQANAFQVNVPMETALVIDHGHLYQILNNLLVNACRYGSGQVGCVQLYSDSPSEGITALHILDDGPGISEQIAAHIFEPFHTSDPKGTGLGLYIARELAEGNDSSLELHDPRHAHFILTGQSLL